MITAKTGIWSWQSSGNPPSWDELFMMIAEVAATRSSCDRGPNQRFRYHKGTGAVVVSPDNRRMAIGYNGSPPKLPHCDDVGHEMYNNSCIRTVHAEKNAILNASFDLKGCKVYSTTVPCYDCCKHLISVGIAEVVYQHIYHSERTSIIPVAGLDLLAKAGVCHRQLKLDEEVGSVKIYVEEDNAGFGY